LQSKEILPAFDMSKDDHRRGANALVTSFSRKQRNVFLITIPWITDRLVRDGLATKLGFFDEDGVHDLTRSEFVHTPSPGSRWKHSGSSQGPKRNADVLVVRDNSGVRHSFVVDSKFLSHFNKCVLRKVFGVTSADERVIKNKCWAELHAEQNTAWYDNGPSMHIHLVVFFAPPFMINRLMPIRRVRTHRSVPVPSAWLSLSATLLRPAVPCLNFADLRELKGTRTGVCA
jgi:hypothetical protein